MNFDAAQQCVQGMKIAGTVYRACERRSPNLAAGASRAELALKGQTKRAGTRHHLQPARILITGQMGPVAEGP
jgi:hypothetical protein